MHFFRRSTAASRLLLLYFAAWIFYFGWFWSHAVFFDSIGNFWAGQINIWGDWAAHFTMATAIAERGPFIGSPFIVGAQFSYPIAADWLSAILLNLGMAFVPAFIIPSFCFSLLMVFALFVCYKKIFRSQVIAVLASLVFLLNGGAGAVYFVQDLMTSPAPLQTLISPPHEYTRLDKEQLKWISVIDSMIIPQRAFALGFPIAIIAITLIWLAICHHKPTNTNERRRYFQLIVSGILIGLLPILHTHSFLAVFMILSCWSIGDMIWLISRRFKAPIVARFKLWLTVVLTVTLISLPLLHWLVLGHAGANFVQWYPGWLAREYNMNWLLFWLKNWGITPYVAILGAVLFYRNTKKELRALRLIFLFPFFAIFILANLFLFQPFPWDNTKLIVWSAFGFAGFAGYAIWFIAHHRMKFHLNVLGAAILFFFMIASGTIDAYWELRTPLHSWQMYSAEDVELAAWAKANSSKTSIWLTGNNHNHWLFNLIGRQPVMAYPGWLWSYGYRFEPVQRDVGVMYTGGAESRALLKKYNVAYVVIGPFERHNLAANEVFFAQNWPMVERVGETQIYQISNQTANE